MTILGNTLALLVVLSVLVVIHEFGHFAVAKAFRFPVEVFSFGFGKRLFGKTWNGTDYRVSAIPLGGSCGSSGSDPTSRRSRTGAPRKRLRSGNAGCAR
jgi:regulator of sigma E protease